MKSTHPSPALFYFALTLLTAAVGCGSSPSGDGSDTTRLGGADGTAGSDGTSNAPANCVDRCSQKASLCALANPEGICEKNVCDVVNDTQLQCFVSLDCDTLQRMNTVCGFTYRQADPGADGSAGTKGEGGSSSSGGPDGSSSSGGPDGSSSSGPGGHSSTGDLAGFGEACACPHGDDGEVLCQSTSGPCDDAFYCLNNHGICTLRCDDGHGEVDPTICPAGYDCATTEVGLFCLPKGE